MGRGWRAAMPAIRALFVAGLATGLTGCAHDISRLSHDCPGKGGWCPEARRVAAAAWPYAQMAQNAYWQGAEESDGDYVDRLYVLPYDIRERFASVDDRYGYAYSIYDRIGADGRLAEVILAYRGTEGPKDWWHGTLLGRQGPRGLATYRQVREGLDRAGHGAVPVTLAGHSLGGRIADHVLERVEREDGALPPTLSSYLFNSNAGGDDLTLPRGQDRPFHTAISESGEIASMARAAALDGAWDGYVIDCQITIDPVRKHYMRRLADCLTWVAAIDSAEARLSVERNEILPPPVNGGPTTPKLDRREADLAG